MSADILARLEAIQASIATLAPVATPTVTVAELWALFELSERERLASWRDYAQRWRDHVCPAFGATVAGAVTIDAVDAFRARRRSSLAAMATVNREIALLRRLLAFGVRRAKLTRSPLHGPGMTKELIHPEHNVRTTVIEEDPGAAAVTLADLLAAADPRLRAFILLVHHNGMRRAEAANLRRDRIDWGRGLAWLPAGETKGGYGGRTVPVSSQALAALRAMPVRYPDSPWVFPSHHHGVKGTAPLHPDYWTHAFGRLVRRLKLDGPDAGPPWLHDLRRSFVTLSRRDGESERGIMQVSGHKTRSVFDRYDAHDVQDILRFRARREIARAGRRGPHHAPARAEENQPVIEKRSGQA